MKKVLSIIFAVAMCISCISVAPVTAFAADGFTTVQFDGLESNANVKTALDDINTYRNSYGVAGFVADANLTAIARQRAKELFIYADSLDTLPDGRPITAYVPGYDDSKIRSFYDEFVSSAPSVYDIETAISFVANASVEYQSIGIGVFTYGSTSTYYILLSAYPAASVCTDFSDVYSTASVYTNTSNIRANLTAMSDGKYARYNISVIAYPQGYAYALDLTNQFTYSSTSPSVLKVKDKIAYPKKNGSVTINATSTLDSSYVLSVSDSIDYFNSVKIQKLTLKTPKKKQLKATWTYNVSDASGYEIQYSTSSKFTGKTTKKVSVKGKKTLSKTISSLKSKKTYYVRVRAYINQGNGEKCYTSWSKTSKIKVK